MNNHKQLLFDFGQNMAATVQVTFHSLTNQNNKIELKTGEILNDGLGNLVDRTGSDGPRFTLHRRNLNSNVNGPERSSEQFIVNDKDIHTFLARFTFHGFRYIEASSKYPVIIDSIRQVRSVQHQIAPVA